MTPNLDQAHQHEHDHQAVPPDPALRVKALESLLVEKGLVDRAALDTLVDAYEHKIGPAEWRTSGGAGVVRSCV
jgi:nitrile hydratase subunit alpha